jgi:hypothetical protein
VGVIIPVVIGLVIVGVLVYSIFLRRHGESDRPQPDWRPTDEVFNDPSTNRVMRVWLDGSGERRYVPEAEHRSV